jgi:hypothetical protein
VYVVFQPARLFLNGFALLDVSFFFFFFFYLGGMMIFDNAKIRGGGEIRVSKKPFLCV